MKILNEKTKNALELLAGVTEITETQGSRKGIEFNFKNSLKANFVKIVEYQDKYIIQFRKIDTDPFTGKSRDKLVFESIVKEQEIQDVFEKQTGIYISGLMY